MEGLAARARLSLPPALLDNLRCRAAHAARGSATVLMEPVVSTHMCRQASSSRRLSPAAAAAAAAPPASSVKSCAGLAPEKLLGFTVLNMTKQGALVGVVDDVLAVAETGEAQPLLHVRAPADPALPEEAPREEHLIPFVPQIVPSYDPTAGLVFVQPPSGLLDLGRQQLLLAHLQRDLEPYTSPPPLSLLSRMGLRVMPSAKQLEEAGRPDLVTAVKQAGGFLEVASYLGLRSQRKPAGFWEDDSNLDEELTLFVAAHWTRFQDPESRQSYWYNQITHRITWEEPILPERVDLDDEGSYMLTEAEDDRVMPSKSAVKAAGRYDLHHAIVQRGGYTATGQQLGRRSAWPPSQHLGSLPTLRQELRAFLKETGLRPNRMPTASQLVDAGRGDLLQAIVQRGGFVATARMLGWATQRRGRSAWQDPQAVATELRQFILEKQFPELAGRQPGRRRQAPQVLQQWAAQRGVQQQRSQQQQELQQQEQRQQEADVPALPPEARLPTHAELARAGRHDLRYAMQRHGSCMVAALLGIECRRSGAHNRGLSAAAEGSSEAAAAAAPACAEEAD